MESALRVKISEFTNIEDIIRFWKASDGDQSQDVTLIEYVQARGNEAFFELCKVRSIKFRSRLTRIRKTCTHVCTGLFEKYGSPYEQDEFARRENTLLEEYYENLRSDGPQLDRFEYDEDGIIVREL